MRFDPAHLVVLPVCVLSIVVHEWAHGRAALWCGDASARDRGRLTLSPLPHLRVFGSLVLPALLLALHSPVLYGWGRPAPIDRARLRRPQNDAVKVALAGPAANLGLALGFAALARLAPESGFWEPLRQMGYAGVLWNCSVFLIEMIPIPPLDGSWALMRFLSLRHIVALHQFSGLGLALAALLLAFPGASGPPLLGPLRLAVHALLDLVGAPREGAPL